MFARCFAFEFSLSKVFYFLKECKGSMAVGM